METLTVKTPVFPVPTNDLELIKRSVLDAVTSPLTRHMYAVALDRFLAWWQAQGRPGFNRATVERYRAALEAQGLAPASVNQKLTAIRKLATEAAHVGFFPPSAAQDIRDVRGAKRQGVRTGHGLTKRQAERLLKAPDTATLKGRRDRAILAVLIGCGLGREEAARLTFAHLAQRKGRWCVVDLVGKHGRIRTLPRVVWQSNSSALPVTGCMREIAGALGPLAGLLSWLINIVDQIMSILRVR